jgi:hypothetical protein
MVRRTYGVWLALSLAVAVSPLPLLAQGRGHGPKGKEERGEQAGEAAEHGRGPLFQQRDRRIIQDYFRGHRNAGLPPGLAKRGGNLPPGLERQLERNGQLPPGLQKRVEPLPLALERRLGRLPRGYRRGIIGTNIVLLGPRSRIADILYDVLAPR